MALSKVIFSLKRYVDREFVYFVGCFLQDLTQNPKILKYFYQKAADRCLKSQFISDLEHLIANAKTFHGLKQDIAPCFNKALLDRAYLSLFLNLDKESFIKLYKLTKIKPDKSVIQKVANSYLKQLDVDKLEVLVGFLNNNNMSDFVSFSEKDVNEAYLVFLRHGYVDLVKRLYKLTKIKPDKSVLQNAANSYIDRLRICLLHDLVGFLKKEKIALPDFSEKRTNRAYLIFLREGHVSFFNKLYSLTGIKPYKSVIQKAANSYLKQLDVDKLEVLVGFLNNNNMSDLLSFSEKHISRAYNRLRAEKDYNKLSKLQKITGINPEDNPKDNAGIGLLKKVFLYLRPNNY